MPGVTVSIKNAATNLERTATTDTAGQFVAAALAPGRYHVVAHLDGFQDQVATSIWRRPKRWRSLSG
jgi:hypothetical protein